MELKDEQIDKCNQEKSKLTNQALVNDQKIKELESEVNKISTRLTQAQSDLSICQKNLGKECKEVDQSLKDEVKRLEDELADVRINLNQCNSNLTKTNDANLVLNNEISNKVKDLEECSSSLLKVKNQVKALEKKIEELKVEKQNNDEKIEKLTQENAILVARNETITSDHNKLKKDLQNKDEIISTLNSKILAVYKSSCNKMHERYQNYYDGATSDKPFFDKLIDHFLSSWFSTRYSDTKLIWEESSLKELLCDWQRDGIVKQNAIIKVKDSLDEYTLERMCTDKDLIENFPQDILNPCGDESNIWNYDHD